MPREKGFASSVFSIAKGLFELWCCCGCGFDASMENGIELVAGIWHGQVIGIGIKASFVEVRTNESLVAVEFHEVEDLLLSLEELRETF